MKNNIVVVFSSHLSEEENQNFIKHIDDTIGVKHKTLCYPNHNQYSLAQIYNNAIENHKEKNSIFVMCHNDIIMKTKNWGKILLTKFNNTDYDILGVAGSTYLPESGQWWEDRTKMKGIVEHTNGINNWVSEYSKPSINITDVILIDGLFMVFNPDTIIHEFDESYNGFHFYDLAFCIPNYLDGCNIGVTTSIRILHKSIGATNQQWELNRQQFAEHWNDELPLTILPPFEYDSITIDDEPKVTVVIPTKNNLKYIRNNLYSWREVVTYNNYEIIIADTGSDDEVIKAYDSLLNDNVRLVRYDYYNFAKINNDVVRNHVSDDTELILFCNDDITLLNDGLTRAVAAYCEDEESVGTIGIRLHYGDGSIQHNGITIAHDGTRIRLSHRDIRKTSNYQTKINYNSQGNTGGFMLIPKKHFDSLGGFNEEYIECLEDVELNLKLKQMGLRNITVSDAVAFHFESVSRNKIDGGEQRFAADFNRLSKFIEDNQIKL